MTHTHTSFHFFYYFKDIHHIFYIHESLNDDIRKSAVANMAPKILGAPIGSSEFCRDFASRKRDKACELLRALPRLQNPQIALSILRRCAGFCRLAHIARATPVEFTVAALALFDDDMRRSLDESAAIESTDSAWQQAQLSTRRGGLGLRSVAHHAGAGFIASYTASCTEPSAHLHEAVLHLNERVCTGRSTWRGPTERRQTVTPARIVGAN